MPQSFMVKKRIKCHYGIINTDKSKLFNWRTCNKACCVNEKYKEMVTDTQSTEQQADRTIMFASKFGEISVLSPLVRDH
jgi:MANEC domain.